MYIFIEKKEVGGGFVFFNGEDLWEINILICLIGKFKSLYLLKMWYFILLKFNIYICIYDWVSIRKFLDEDKYCKGDLLFLI